MSEKVRHIISGQGLEHGAYYRVYVTQVNQAGLESPKTSYDLIRVGDVAPPGEPGLSLDGTFGVRGFQKHNGAVDVGLNITPPVCDDLSHMILYVWYNADFFTVDGIYDGNKAATASEVYWITNGATIHTLTNQKNQRRIYIGIQAEDLSGNRSNITIITLIPEDTSCDYVPDALISVVPGVWQLAVSITCPTSNEIASVIFFRDNDKQLTPVNFYSGLKAEVIDQLGVEDGLSHYYTYLYVDKNGNKSRRSNKSVTATAKTIDMALWDKEVLDVLKDLYGTDMETFVPEVVEQALISRDAEIVKLYKALESVTTSFNELYQAYTVTANKISLWAPNFTQNTDGTYTVKNTSYQQDPDWISLKAFQNNWTTSVDGRVNGLLSNYASEFRIGSKSVSTVVSEIINNLNTNPRLTGSTYTHAYSSFVVMANGIQSKVSKGSLQSEIDQTAGVIRLKAGKIVLEGDCLVDGTLNAKKLMQGSISIDKMLQSAWTPCWSKYIFPSNEYNTATAPWQYPSTHKNQNWRIAEPSLGGIQFSQGTVSFDVPAMLWEMNVWCKYPQIIVQVLRVVDDNFNYYVNGVHLHSTGQFQGARALYTQLYGGNNLIQIVVNNQHWGQTALTLQGDIIDNINIFFNGNGTGTPFK